MSTTTATPTTPLRGDICPPWCGGRELHRVDRDGTSTHPDDYGVEHRSDHVDAWVPQDGNNPIIVYIGGFRHDHPEVTPDWVDTIWATGEVNPGCLGDVNLHQADARRLAEALVRACDIAEGRA